MNGYVLVVAWLLVGDQVVRLKKPVGLVVRNAIGGTEAIPQLVRVRKRAEVPLDARGEVELEATRAARP